MNESRFRISLGYVPKEREVPRLAAPAIIAADPTKNWVMDSELEGLVPLRREDGRSVP